jgi:hypothetical protein
MSEDGKPEPSNSCLTVVKKNDVDSLQSSHGESTGEITIHRKQRS